MAPLEDIDVKTEEPLYFEDILKIIGGYGKYQKKIIIFVLVPISVILPFVSMGSVFIMSVPDHWCVDSSLDNFNLTEQDKQQLLRPMEIKNGVDSPSQCEVYNYTDVIDNGIWQDVAFLRNLSKTLPKKACDNGYDYDKISFKSTASTKWNLVCEKDYLPSLVYTMETIGAVIGTPVFGLLSDRFGRRTVFLITIIVALVTSCLTVVVQDLIVFFVVRCVNGMLMPSAYQLPFIIMMEMVAPEVRASLNFISSVAWATGLSLLSLAAYLCADFTIFGWVCFGMIMSCTLCYWFLPESPRWMISKERISEAAMCLQKIADENGKTVTPEELLLLIKNMKKVEEDSSEGKTASIVQLLRYPKLRKRYLIITLSWVSCGVSYYAFNLNATQLAGNQFMNFFLLALAEMPAHFFAVFFMGTKLGRRWSNVAFSFLMAISCFIPSVVPADMSQLLIAVSIIGKFGTSAAFVIVYQQASELFPTPVRASAMSIASTLSSVLSICSPSIIYLGTYGKYIPFLMMSVWGFLAGMVLMFLPETLNENLPQTFIEGEHFGNGEKFFSLAKKKKENLKDVPIGDISTISHG